MKRFEVYEMALQMVSALPPAVERIRLHDRDLAHSSNAPAPRCQATSLKAPARRPGPTAPLPDCRGLRRRTPLTSGRCHGLG